MSGRDSAYSVGMTNDEMTLLQREVRTSWLLESAYGAYTDVQSDAYSKAVDSLQIPEEIFEAIACICTAEHWAGGDFARNAMDPDEIRRVVNQAIWDAYPDDPTARGILFTGMSEADYARSLAVVKTWDALVGLDAEYPDEVKPLLDRWFRGGDSA